MRVPVLVLYSTVNPPVKGHESSAELGLTKFVILKVADCKEFETAPMLIVRRDPENEHEDIVMTTD